MASTKCVVVGVAGGSGSGKTTLARALVTSLGAENVTHISHDFYYRDLNHLRFEEREKINFDHPDALETSLLVKHLGELRAGRSVEIPIYDFTKQTRKTETRRVESKGVIIVEGILIFCHAELRDLLDVKIFVDTDADIRFIRRLRRDVAERSRTTESVVQQYLRTVRPMHELFVVPSKIYCDMVILDSLNSVVLDMVLARLRPCLHSTVPTEGARPPEESS